MASVPSLLIISLLGSVCRAEKAVFLSEESASSVLVRQKRHNTIFEELLKGNLERECIEEQCSYEEAREVFENDEKTMEFWRSYADGDQCLGNPCLNGGVCKDDVNSYTCYCRKGYEGRECELVLPVTCTIDNGGCQQMCREDAKKNVICSCAYGYKLGEDGKSCNEIVPYPCGKVSAPEAMQQDVTRSILAPEDFNVTSHYNHSSTKHLPPDTTSDDIVPVTVNPNIRIVGGTDSLKGEFPWQVHLINNLQVSFCGGSIVNERWIVTAAHCFLITNQFSVVAGDHNTLLKDGTEQYLKVSKVITHPSYNSSISKYNFDIALVKLEKPIVLNDYARPICIGNKNFTDKLMMDAPYSWVTGWGQITYQGVTSAVLQKLSVPYVDRSICKTSSKYQVSGAMFCAGYSDQRMDSCLGDSGGPHASKFKDIWFLTGITSWGEKCAQKGKYGVYTRLSRFTDWIVAIIRRY